MRTPALAASLASLAAASALHAQTRVVYVDHTAPPGGDGSSWSRAFRELDVALRAVAASDLDQITRLSVYIAQGTYRPSMGAVSDSAFDIAGDSRLTSAFTFSMMGSFAGLRAPDPYARDFVTTPTTLSGDVLADDLPGFQNREENRGPVLTAQGGSSTSWKIELDGLRFAGGHNRSTSGGGVQLDLSGSGLRAEVNGCVVVDNQAHDAGGIYVRLRGSSAIAHIGHTDVRQNLAARDAGGILIDGLGYVFNSTLASNLATDRAGGLLALAPVQISRCRALGNAASRGGGLFGSVQIENSLVAANSADTGAGAFLVDGNLSSSTFADNHARVGGALHLNGFSTHMSNMILARNSALLAGLHIAYDVVTSPLVLHHVLLEGGVQSIAGPLGPYVSSESVVYTFAPGFVNPTGPDGDPLDWRDNDYHLRLGSRAIDAGIGSAGPYDLDWNNREQPRRLGGRPLLDLGCFEYQPHCPADTNQDDGVTTDDLLDFLTAFTLGQPLADIGDGSQTNTPDDGVTVEDLLYFLSRYNAGC